MRRNGRVYRTSFTDRNTNNRRLARSSRVSSRRVARLPAELQRMVREYYVAGLRNRMGQRRTAERSARATPYRIFN